MKKILALVIAALMLLGMVSAFAETNVTENVVVNTHAHDSFKAIQIFSGTQDASAGDNAPLGNIGWGTDVAAKTADIISAVNAVGATSLPTTAEAKLVAEAIASFTTAQAEQLAKRLDAILSSIAGTTITGTTVLPTGYYLIIDTSTIGDGDAKNTSLLQLTKNITIATKTDAPNIEKKLKNHEEPDTAYRDVNNVAIGDVVDYKITSAVPNMEHYDQYYFIVNDTLSKGLTFNDNLVVKVGNKTLTATTSDTDEGETYKLNKNTDANGNTTLEIVFSNFLQYKAQTGDEVVITYTATLNEDAKVGTEGNLNEVELVYSNNPNKTGGGKNKPGDQDDVTGKTPKDWTETYTVNVKILKVDAVTKQILPGVQFTIKGYKENEVVTYTEVFEEDANGEYWKLTNDTYTTKAPNALTASDYASTSTKYKLVVKKNSTTEVTPITATATTDSNGILDIGAVLRNQSVGSMSAGKFIITEAQTLNGYNLLDEAIIVELTHAVGGKTDAEATIDGDTACTWNSSEGSWDSEKKAYVITVENSKGSTLPETGGIGTTLFYVGGGLLALAAVILLVTKRRMSGND